MIPGHKWSLWQQTMQGRAETGVGTKNCVVLHTKNGILASVFSDSFQVLYLSELWCFGVLD